VVPATAERPPTRRLHLGFAAPSRAHVDAFWRAGVDAGFADDGAPGPRPQYTPSYYGGFLRDPDGNSAEAVHKDGMRTDGLVDHLWIRVADLGSARAFYRSVLAPARLRPAADTEERVSFARDGDGGGSLSLVPGEATEHVRLAFGAIDVEVGAQGVSTIAAY
jgi:catechol 2,3-dioxygenase-like lactoylglutathione lyase family enzyme